MADFFFKELPEYPGVNNLTVILMGMGIVFVGLIVLILVCSIMGKICMAAIKKPAENTAGAAAPAPAPAAADDGIADRGAFIAAVSAAIAEASGTDAAGIRIVKIEKK